MVARKKKEEATPEISVTLIDYDILRVRLIGRTPLLVNSMSAKAKQTLFIGGRKKTAAEKATVLKHDPFEEFREALELMETEDAPTVLAMRNVAVKAGLAATTVEVPGATAAGIKRLVRIPGEKVPLYGTPQLRLDVTRNSDPGRTPDIRTRAILPQWGAELVIHYARPQLNPTAIINLLHNMGLVNGMGDYRAQKGGDFGSFRVVSDFSEPDAEWDDLVANHARAAQIEAINDPQFATIETAQLMDFYFEEVRRRDMSKPRSARQKVVEFDLTDNED